MRPTTVPFTEKQPPIYPPKDSGYRYRPAPTSGTASGLVAQRIEQQRKQDATAYPDLVRRAAQFAAGAIEQLIEVGTRLGVLPEDIDKDVATERTVEQAEQAETAADVPTRVAALEREGNRLNLENERLREQMKQLQVKRTQVNCDIASANSLRDMATRARSARSRRMTRNDFTR